MRFGFDPSPQTLRSSGANGCSRTLRTLLGGLKGFADTILLYQAEPNNLEVVKELEAGLEAILDKKQGEDPILSRGDALEVLTEDCFERIEELSVYLNALEEEGPEVWEDRWAETGLDLRFDEHYEGVENEIAVNQDVGLLLEALVNA